MSVLSDKSLPSKLPSGGLSVGMVPRRVAWPSMRCRESLSRTLITYGPLCPAIYSTSVTPFDIVNPFFLYLSAADSFYGGTTGRGGV